MAELFDIISAKLESDTGAGGVNDANNGATGGFHRNKAPQGSTYPRIHVKLLTGLPSFTMTQEAARAVFVQFTVFAKDPQGLPEESSEPGAARAARLSKRIQTLFFDADLAANDPEFIGSRLDRELPSSTEEDEANGETIYSEGCVLKMWTA